MRARCWLVCGGLIFCVLLGPSFFLSLADANAEVTVRVDGPDKAEADSDVIVKIDVTKVTDLDVCQFDVSYDPRVLRITDVTAGDIGGTTVPIDMWGEVAPGRVRILGNVPGIPGVDGAGYLAEIHFHVIGSPGDASDIGLSNGLLGDKYAEAIGSVSWEGEGIEVAASPLVKQEKVSVTSAPGPEFTGTAPLSTEPTLIRVVSSSASVRDLSTPAVSANEGEAENEGFPSLTYGLVFPMMVTLAAAFWIYGRRKSDQRGRRSDEK